MAENSKIEWTDHTFNPWIGCTNVSPACDHCYAEALDHRWGHDSWGTGKPRRRTSEANWKKPLAWDRKAARLGIRYRVFCASLADVFDAEVPDAWRVDLFVLIEATQNLDWLLLTKRPKVAREFLTARPVLPNVWLGATVVNQKMANLRVPLLLDTPAAIRFLSMEPLLEEVDLYRGGFSLLHCVKSPAGKQHTRLDWVIVGGESGPQARDMDPAWARSLRDQCAGSAAAFFFKQMTRKAAIPPDLMVREFPRSPKDTDRKADG